MSAAALIKQADLKRIFGAAKGAGVSVRIELEPNGKIIIMPAAQGDAIRSANPWDEELTNAEKAH
jgi:hypothetical protein